MEENNEGAMLANGGWQANVGSKFRSLNRDEVLDLQKMAETVTPSFTGPHNAKWEDHHPITRKVWEKKGISKESN
jgi:hypothetical protein